MSKNRDLISKSLKNPAKEILIDVSELGLDELTGKIYQETEFLKQLPIVKWLFIGNDIRSTIQSVFFLKKFSNFIGQISNSQQVEGDDEKLLIILSDKGKFEKVIENTILYLDRYHNELKAKLLGELFVQTLKHQKFTVREYNSLMYSIEVIHPFDGVERLKDFYEYKIKMDAEINEVDRRKIWSEGSKLDYQPLSISGLLSLPKGASTTGDLGGAYLNDLGERFYEFVVSNCINQETTI